MSKNIWFTSDLHLGHKAILRLSNRPFFNIEEHDETIIENINKLVKNDDDLIILGDISFNQSYQTYESIFKKLNGNIYIILGNHDNKQNLIRCQKEGLITSVRESQIMNIGKDTIHLTHYPLLEWYNFYNNGLHAHGHTHGKVNEYCRSIDVSIDAWEMECIEFSELKQYIDENCTENIHYI